MRGAHKLIALLALVAAIPVVAIFSIRVARLDTVEEYEALVAAHIGKLVGKDENEYVKCALGFSPHAGEEKVLLLHCYVKKEEPNQSFSYSLVNPQTHQDFTNSIRAWNKAEPHGLVLTSYRCRRLSSHAFDLSDAKPGEPLRFKFGVGQSLVTTKGNVSSTTLQPDKLTSVFEFVAP